MAQPLAGVKVIDVTSFVAGPYCTMLLGDMGADVIKIEPKHGDMVRYAGPFIGGEGAYFLYANRNKRSMTLNLKKAEGRDILLRLLTEADVFVENFKPQIKKKLGIDHATAAKRNSRLVYCSISGFGQTGPWSERPGFDQIAQGMSGLMSVTGLPDSGPVRAGVAIGDSVAALFATYGILAALYEREHSGTGQYLDTSLLEGLVALLGFQAAKYFGTGDTPLQQGNDHGTIAPYGTYRTRDGYMNIAAATPPMWEKLCELLGLQNLDEDERFGSIPDRVENKDALRKILEEKLKGKPTREWLDIFAREGIACGPIYTVDHVFRDDHVLHRDMLMEIDHPNAGTMKMIGFPVKMQKTPCRARLAPPTLGQHTREILKSMDYSEHEMDELEKNDII